MGLYSDLYESFGYLCGIQLIAHINLVASQVAQWEESAKQEMWVGSTSESGRSPGEENGNQLQYSCLGNPMDRGTWWATVQGGHKRVGHNLVSKQQQCMVSREQARVKSMLHRGVGTQYGGNPEIRGQDCISGSASVHLGESYLWHVLHRRESFSLASQAASL